MQMQRWILRSFSLGTAAVVGAASLAAAQWGGQSSRNGRDLFEWRGRVDREVQVVMRGDRVWTNQIGRTEPNNQRSRTLSSLPRQDGEIVVRRDDGRGRVDVIQQPNARNGYTAIVRIVDPASGSDNYRLTAYWQGSAYRDVYDRNDRRDGRDDRNGGVWSRDRSQGDDDWDNGNRRRSVLRWTGNVDDELEIRVQNGRVEYRTMRGAAPTSIRVNTNAGTMPRSNAQVRVAMNQGRGNVTVTQQPSSRNGYTTVLRVRDPQGGYGYYDFDLMLE